MAGGHGRLRAGCAEAAREAPPPLPGKQHYKLDLERGVEKHKVQGKARGTASRQKEEFCDSTVEFSSSAKATRKLLFSSLFPPGSLSWLFLILQN